MIKCVYCLEDFHNKEFLDAHVQNAHIDYRDNIKEAIRITRNIRYDILDPNFLEGLAKIADYGAKKYGDFNWHSSRLEGDKSPVNHMYKHLGSYRKKEAYDHPELSTGYIYHLYAIAFNAMMEAYYVLKYDASSETASESKRE